MSLPHTDAEKAQWVTDKRKTMPDAICWNCKHRKDEFAPHPCVGRKRYQSGYCVDFVSLGVKK